MLTAITCSLAPTEHAAAQFPYTGGVLVQDFDSLPSSGTFSFSTKGPQELDQSPINASGASGWSVYARVGNPLLFKVDTGASTSASCYSYGLAGDADRALGSLGGAHVANLGCRLINTTGQTITEFTVAYRGEQWRNGGSQNPNKLEFAYRITPTITTGIDNTSSYTLVPALDFTSPSLNPYPFAANGNVSARREEKAATISGVNWPNGHLLILRWRDFDETGSDDGLAIDDVVFHAVTTPTTPFVHSIKPAPGQSNVTVTSPVSITFNQPVTCSGTWAQLEDGTSNVVPVTIAGGPIRYELTPTNRLQPGQNYALSIFSSQVTNGSGAPMSADYVTAFTTQPAVTNLQPINVVQGSGTSTPLNGQIVTVQAVVTADFQGPPPALGGFFVQSLPADEDSDPATSEGLFVYDFTSQGSDDVSVGDVVTVTGTAGEFGSQTQLSNITSLVKAGTAALPVEVDAALPSPSSTSLEPLEGMRVRFPQTLHVTSVGISSNFIVDYARNGELMLSSDGPLIVPTEETDPNDDPASGTTSSGSSNAAAVSAASTANSRRTIILDDASSATYPDPTPYLNAQGTRRCGDTVTGLAGILSYASGRYRIQPTGAVTFVDANPRPDSPPIVGGRVKVAAMNVLNYFTTFGGASDRGADNEMEFQRQKDKVLSALSALNADVLGLIEIQNTGNAVDDILSGLNGLVGAGTYAVVGEPDNGPGGDAIRTVLLYKPASVQPIGPCRSDNDSVWNTPDPLRYPQAQLFEEVSTRERFIACLNHWKSKSSSGATGLNADQNDGQGAWNDLRRQQATRLHSWLQTVCALVGDNDVLILGDLNSHGEEDPLDVLRASGYEDQGARFHPGDYSYRLGEERGRLDHAFASASMAAQVLASDHWHINADEPAFYDYNLENKSPAQQAINTGTPFRSSDHDPVLIGVSLSPQPTTYAMWVASLPWPPGADTQPGADPDGDGMPNLQEFAQHSDPTVQDLTLSPTADLAGNEFRFHYRLRNTAAGIQIQPEWSGDLVHWYPMTAISLEDPADAFTDNLRATLGQSGHSKLFGRLNITLLP